MQDTSALLTYSLVTARTCVAQNGLVIRDAEKQVLQADAQRIYQSACCAVQREFRIIEPVRPAITLIVGAHENEAYADSNEIRLIDWDPYLFAEGVVVFAFAEMLPENKRMAVAKRAVIWATASTDAHSLWQASTMTKNLLLR